MNTVTEEQYDRALTILVWSEAGTWSYSPETLDVARATVRRYEAQCSKSTYLKA